MQQSSGPAVEPTLHEGSTKTLSVPVKKDITFRCARVGNDVFFLKYVRINTLIKVTDESR